MQLWLYEFCYVPVCSGEFRLGKECFKHTCFPSIHAKPSGMTSADQVVAQDLVVWLMQFQESR
jgi:hypothetical protein